jgi:hypothetical protein
MFTFLARNGHANLENPKVGGEGGSKPRPLSLITHNRQVKKFAVSLII